MRGQTTIGRHFDVRYFKGKDVCVFDDVVTTGKSYANFANMLERQWRKRCWRNVFR